MHSAAVGTVRLIVFEMRLSILLRLSAGQWLDPGDAGSWPEVAEAVGRARRPGWIHTRAVFPVVLFGSSVFRNEAYFHTTNSCVVSVVVDYQIFLCVLKVIKRACNGCVCPESCAVAVRAIRKSELASGRLLASPLPPPTPPCLFRWMFEKSQNFDVSQRRVCSRDNGPS